MRSRDSPLELRFRGSLGRLCPCTRLGVTLVATECCLSFSDPRSLKPGRAELVSRDPQEPRCEAVAFRVGGLRGTGPAVWVPPAAPAGQASSESASSPCSALARARWPGHVHHLILDAFSCLSAQNITQQQQGLGLAGEENLRLAHPGLERGPEGIYLRAP